MSARSFKRAHARRIEREQRRLGRLKRRGALAAGTALSASALFAANAQAANYTVNTKNDSNDGSCGVPCSLRDAITAANGDGSVDTITFAPSLDGQTITLGSALPTITHTGGLTISGPGASKLAVSGAGLYQVFLIDLSSPGQTLKIDGLKIEDGSYTGATTGNGGAITNTNADLTLNNDVITGSTTTQKGGGVYSKAGLTVTNSTISGNTAPEGGGIVSNAGYLDVTGSHVMGNHASSGRAGGIYADGDSARIQSTTVSGNTAVLGAGGIDSNTKYGTTITDSAVTGNTVSGVSGVGGGVEIFAESRGYHGGPKYNPIQITDTTVSGNRAPAGGAGVAVVKALPANPITISHSTLSGNTGGASSIGGGLFIEGDLYSPFELVDSTISGNHATHGGGIGLSSGGTEPLIQASSSGPGGSINIDNSTIASNSASTRQKGGGIYLGQYSVSAKEHSGTVGLSSSIVSGNTAAGTPNDLDWAATSTSGGFDASFDLIKASAAPLLVHKSDIIGQNPQLGPLAHNGGPTETMMPSGSSPVIDQGHADAKLTTDQRGQPRTVDVPGILNPPGGDGTDIGAVELAASRVSPTGFGAEIHHHVITKSNKLKLVGSSTPVKCLVKVGLISSCLISVRGPDQTLYAKGSATSHKNVSSLTTKTKLTKAGLSALKNHPQGVTEAIQVTGTTSRSGPQALTGKVLLLAVRAHHAGASRASQPASTASP